MALMYVCMAQSQSEAWFRFHSKALVKVPFQGSGQSPVKVPFQSSGQRPIPGLWSEIQFQRGHLLYELLDQQEVIQTLKQRVSIPHEQNGQLATLVQAETEKGGAHEILAMRNALVASLAQLKRLQQ